MAAFLSITFHNSRFLIYMVPNNQYLPVKWQQMSSGFVEFMTKCLGGPCLTFGPNRCSVDKSVSLLKFVPIQSLNFRRLWILAFLFLKIRTDSTVYGSLPSPLKIQTKSTVCGSQVPPLKSSNQSCRPRIHASLFTNSDQIGDPLILASPLKLWTDSAVR